MRGARVLRALSSCSLCALFVTFAVAAPSCKRASSSGDAATEASALSDADVDAAPTLLPARCKPTEEGATLAEGADLADLEIGEAAPSRDGFAIGVVRKKEGQLVGSVAMASRDAAAVSFVDLGAPYADAPPPRPITQGETTYAFFYSRGETPKPAPLAKGATRAAAVETRELSLYRVAAGKAQLAATLAQQKDESLAFDAALASGDKGMLVAWDEDSIGLLRGEIKVQALGADAKPLGPARAASPSTSDAELPRLARRRGGYWLVWVARRLESPDAAPDPGHEVETPGEKRAFRWLELVLLDERGAVVGAVKRLTSATGHVSIFDLAARDGGGGRDGVEVLDIIARDDEQTVDGSGGRVVRITVNGDAADPPIAIVADAVGRGVPDLLAGMPAGDGASAPAWLVYADTTDHVRLLPLDATRSPLAAPSAEDALDKSRPLLASPSGLLVAVPAEPKRQLKLVPCAR